MLVSATGRTGTAAALLIVLLAAGCGRDVPEPQVTSAPEAAETVSDGPGDPALEDSRVAVSSETLPYAEVDEELIYGHFAYPSDMIEPLTAIVLIHDVWGLNDDIRGLADRIAEEGYMVLAVDLYGGSPGSDVVEARKYTISVVENPDRAASNIQQALRFVEIAGAPATAALGYGLGGTWSLNSAVRFPTEIDAAIVYYGQMTTDAGQLAAIEAPVLGLFGARDRTISMASVAEFEATMRRLGKNPVLQIYAEAEHAFADPTRRAFDAETAADAWQRTMDFLAENLPADES